MKRFLLIPALCLLFVFSISSSANAQSGKKTKITIKKSQNGDTQTIQKEFEGSNEELTKFLKDMGIDIDVNNGNDVMEIIIDQKNFDEEKLSKWSENLLEQFGANRPKSAFLGIKMSNVEEGVFIKEIIENSPAEEIGLKAGDILNSIDGVKVNSTDEVIDIISNHQAGDQIKLSIEREDKKKNYKAELAEKNDEFFGLLNGMDNFNLKGSCQPGGKSFTWSSEDNEDLTSDKPFLGITNGGHSNIIGAVVGSVTSGSTAEKMGLESGDVITSFNGNSVGSWGALVDAIEATNVGDQFSIEVKRNGDTFMMNEEMQARNETTEMHLFNWDNIGGLDFNFDCDKNNFDSEEFEKSMERLGLELQEKLQGLEGLEELENLNFDFDFNGDSPFTESMTVIVLVEELTQEECDKVNENAEHKVTPDNNLELEDVSFYPNPNDGNFNLNFQTRSNGDLTVNIYDQSGKTVYKEMLAEFEGEYNNRIDISERANGTYYLQIIQNNQTFNKKIIKQ